MKQAQLKAVERLKRAKGVLLPGWLVACVGARAARCVATERGAPLLVR